MRAIAVRTSEGTDRAEMRTVFNVKASHVVMGAKKEDEVVVYTVQPGQETQETPPYCVVLTKG